MSFSRSILKHTVVYSAANAAAKLGSFILIPFYAHIFQTEGYGVIALVDSAVGLLSMAFAGAFHSTLVKIYSDKEEDGKDRVIGTGIVIAFLTTIVLVPLPMIFSPWISSTLLGDSQYYSLIILALVSFLFDVTGQAASTTLVIKQKSLLYSTINLARLFLSLGLNILFVLVLGFGLIGVFMSSLVSATMAASTFLAIAIRLHGFHYDRSVAKEIRAFWLPLVPGELIAYLGRQGERFFVRFFVSVGGVGILEMAYKWPPLLNLFIALPFMQAWRPKSFELATSPDGPMKMSHIFTQYYYVLMFAAVLLYCGVSPLIRLLTPESFWAAGRIARIEIATTVLAGANMFLLFGLLYQSKTATITLIRSTVAIGKLFLTGLLVWFAGLRGAAISALCGEIVMLLWIRAAAQRAYRIPFESVRIAACTAAGAILAYLIVGLEIAEQIAAAWLYQNPDSIVYHFVDWLYLQVRGKALDTQLLEMKGVALVQLAVSCLLCLAFLFLAPVGRWRRETKSLWLLSRKGE